MGARSSFQCRFGGLTLRLLGLGCLFLFDGLLFVGLWPLLAPGFFGFGLLFLGGFLGLFVGFWGLWFLDLLGLLRDDFPLLIAHHEGRLAGQGVEVNLPVQLVVFVVALFDQAAGGIEFGEGALAPAVFVAVVALEGAVGVPGEPGAVFQAVAEVAFLAEFVLEVEGREGAVQDAAFEGALGRANLAVVEVVVDPVEVGLLVEGFDQDVDALGEGVRAGVAEGVGLAGGDTVA